MSAFGEGLLSGSRFLFWTLAPFLVLGALAITFPVDYADGAHLAAVIGCDAVALLLVLTLWPWHRVPVVRRLLMAGVGCAFTAYVLDAWAPGLLPRRGEPSSRWMATMGFLVIAVPCWKYVFLGRFRLDPDPIALPADEPLLLRAYERARASLPRLREAFRECPDTTAVRFPFTTSADQTEHLWGRLLALTESEARLEVLTQPLTHDQEVDERTVAVGEIEDWEAELADGTIDGGYTTRAMHAYAERERLGVPREITLRLRRYRSAA